MHSFYYVLCSIESMDINMHEASIIHSAMDIILEKSRENHLNKITKITVRVGEMSGAMPDALRFAFISVSSGTIAEGADFIIDLVKPTAKCDFCNIIFNIDHFNKLCPECKSFSSNIVTGYELYVNTIEGDSNE